MDSKSEARRQKDLLNSGFLNTVGNDQRFSQSPIIFDALENVLTKYGELFVKGFSSELNKSDSNAGGGLDSSLRFEFTKQGRLYETSVYMSDYGKFVDEGVQGVGKNNKNFTSPYKFKFVNPSASHVAALEKWISEKNVTAIITAPKGIVSKLLSPKSLAYAIGYSIKSRGIAATYFKKKTVEKLITDFKAEVAKAAGEDMKINILF